MKPMIKPMGYKKVPKKIRAVEVIQAMKRVRIPAAAVPVKKAVRRKQAVRKKPEVPTAISVPMKKVTQRKAKIQEKTVRTRVPEQRKRESPKGKALQIQTAIPVSAVKVPKQQPLRYRSFLL